MTPVYLHRRTGNIKRYSDNKEFEIKGNGAGGVGGNRLIFRYYRLQRVVDIEGL